MTPHRWVRNAEVGDAPAIVEIMRTAFPRWVIDRTVYGSDGAMIYVAQCIRGAPLATPTFITAGTTGAADAAAEVAAHGRAVFLSYIATQPAVRSLGLGTALLAEALTLGERWDARRMMLDVFDDNARARAWYERLGFTPVGGIAWWETPVPRARRGAPGTVSGLAQADVCHDHFGFSELTIVNGDRSYRVGRLGSEWFRLTEFDAVEQDWVLATLAALDERRTLLLIGDADDPRVAALGLGPPAVRSTRLRSSVSALRASLHRDAG